MKKYTNDMIQRTEYRQARMEEAFQKIRNAVAGYDESILPRIENDEKKADGVKLDEMIEGMIGALRRYFESSKKGKLEKKQEDFYRNYLYLVILTPQIDIDCRIGAFYHGPHFSELYQSADIGREIRYLEEELKGVKEKMTPEELLVVYEQRPWRMPEDEMTGLLYRAKEAYEELTGKNVSEIYSPEEKGYFKEWSEADWCREPLENTITVTVVTKRDESTGDEVTEFEGPEANDQFVGKMPWEIEEEKAYQEYQNSLDPSEEYEKQLKAWQEEDEFILETRKEWENYIPDRDRYIRVFEDFRKAFLQGETDLSLMPECMKHLTDAFLFEQGICAFSLDDYYGLIDRVLDNVPNKIAHEMVRARLFSDDDESC